VKKGLLVAVMVVGIVAVAFATDSTTQTVTMGVDPSTKISVSGDPSALTIVAPGVAGDQPADQSDSTRYIRYTVVVTSGKTRTLTGEITATTGDGVPDGCALKLTAATPVGGVGAVGTSAGQKTLDEGGGAQTLITGIGTGRAGGVGSGSGSQETFTLSVSDFTALKGGQSGTATVTLTFTDEA